MASEDVENETEVFGLSLPEGLTSFLKVQFFFLKHLNLKH